MRKLPTEYRQLVESIADEDDVVFFYLKPGWARDDDVHHVSYERAVMTWPDVLTDFSLLKRCRCGECEATGQK